MLDMNDYTHLTDTLDQLKSELSSQIQNLEDPAFGAFFSGGMVTFSLEKAKLLMSVIQQASKAIHILEMDSLQLDMQEERMNRIRSDFAELYSAHTLLATGNVDSTGTGQLNNVVSSCINNIKSNL
jgi:hypothetical protein